MKKIFIVAAHPDDEVLGCGGTILKHKKNGDKIFVLFVSEGVSARYKNKGDPKCLKEIKDRQAMAVKASKIAKFEIVDFMNSNFLLFFFQRCRFHDFFRHLLYFKLPFTLRIFSFFLYQKESRFFRLVMPGFFFMLKPKSLFIAFMHFQGF